MTLNELRAFTRRIAAESIATPAEVAVATGDASSIARLSLAPPDVPIVAVFVGIEITGWRSWFACVRARMARRVRAELRARIGPMLPIGVVAFWIVDVNRRR